MLLPRVAFARVCVCVCVCVCSCVCAAFVRVFVCVQGGCVESDMCVTFRSNEFETISLKTDEKGVFPTAAAMLRDCFAIIRTSR